jgi:hypothetical protein
VRRFPARATLIAVRLLVALERAHARGYYALDGVVVSAQITRR